MSDWEIEFEYVIKYHETVTVEADSEQEAITAAYTQAGVDVTDDVGVLSVTEL